MSKPSRTPDLPRILVFKSTWCPPCTAMTPALERLSAQLAGRVEVEVLDTTEHMAVAARHNVMAVPTLVGLVGEQVVAHEVGYAGPARLEDLFERVASAGAG